MKIASIRLNSLRIIFELTVNLLKPPKVYLRNFTISEIIWKNFEVNQHFISLDIIYDDLNEVSVPKKIVLRKQVSKFNGLHVIDISKKDQIVLFFVITVVHKNFEM